jgi:beta-glucosidase
MDDPVMRRFLAGMPLDVISEFPQSPVSPEAVRELVAVVATTGGATPGDDAEHDAPR